ncbi:unnamed protein product [Rotaria socialis]|uniref:CCHC-type domain-containing protein n=1 Tax=Rotaria socialis TaxID=392032 RepID=A0A817XZ12_9BILA|nr:unnamed protein product [Rotaria socialis]CAF3765917.1 unnamed protein product [Rotaria socialis]CAF4574967.1 unnamed protein product [Rotaria socialis]CAF4858386.1 unnamed protein product [Rotaria socialis]
MPMVIMQNGQLSPLNQIFPPSLYGFPPTQLSRSINTYNMTHSSEQIEVPENTHSSPCDANVHSTPTINKRTRDDQRTSDQISNQQQPVNNLPTRQTGQLFSTGYATFRQVIENEHVVTNQVGRFATTRYSFSPFIVHFKEDLRDKLVVEHLVKNAKEQCNNFDLHVLGYCRIQRNCVVAEYDILVFVENTQSFAFLRDVGNWPAQLVGKEYTRKMPSISPQLSGVIQNVAFNVDWDEFVQDLKRQYPQVANVIRLKNRNLKDLKLVKVKFNSATIRNKFLEGKYVYVHFMRYPVVEYMALAQVLICSRCMHIGHFQKNCPQKDEVTCKICGAICADLKKTRMPRFHLSLFFNMKINKDKVTPLLSTRNKVQANQLVKNNPAFTTSNFPWLNHLSPANTFTANDNHVDTFGMF